MAMAEKKQPQEHPPTLITSLPHDIIVDVVARLPRCDHPSISLFSKSFRSLMASPELYARRSSLGCTEHCLYAILHDYYTGDYRLYILRRKIDSNRLVVIRSLPGMPPHGSYLAVGSRINVLGGLYLQSALSIDCRSHTVQLISDFPNYNMADTDVVVFNDGTIYVIANYLWDDEVTSEGKWCSIVIELDTETRMLKPKMPKLGAISLGNVVVMEDKIYMRDSKNSFVYVPKENKWEIDETLNSMKWESACVVDDVLYYYDDEKNRVRAYDPKEKCWRVVYGLGKLLLKTVESCYSHSVSYGERVATFFFEFHGFEQKTTVIWGAEIAFERGRGGEIWGKVQWCDVVLNEGSYHMVKALAVRV